MISHLKKEKGMTLIELLSSLVILSIVLIGFLSVFTQSAKMQHTNEENLVASNIARTALDDVRELKSVPFDIGQYTQFNIENHPSIPSVKKNGQFKSHSAYYLKLQFSKEPDTPLWLTKIIILNEHDEQLADTYTYIEVNSDD